MTGGAGSLSVDSQLSQDGSAGDARERRRLRRENAELRRANEILKPGERVFRRGSRPVCVPEGDPAYAGIDLAQLPEHQLVEIAHFVDICRDLDPERGSSPKGGTDRRLLCTVWQQGEPAHTFG
jgi:hypothetical protein